MEGEDDIYQTPVVDSQTVSIVPGPSSGMKRSDTDGNLNTSDSQKKGATVLDSYVT